jgi:predicted RNase H-like HicB family nuclease
MRYSRRQDFKMEKNLEYYLNLPWSYRIKWNDIDNCFLGSIKELEENMTCGDTHEEVFANLKEALKAYILTSLKANLEIPEPVKLSD